MITRTAFTILAGTALLAFIAPSALAHDTLVAPQPGRLPALVVGQGPGVGLPGVTALLAAKPNRPFALFVEVAGQSPLLLTGGVLPSDGMLHQDLVLPAEVLSLPLNFRAAVFEGRTATLSPDAPLNLGSAQTCRVEDWEDHDCGTGAGCDNGDGDSPSAPGQIVTCQWEDEWGCVSAVNHRPGGPQFAVIFDSANPTGGDSDLATPIESDPAECELPADGLPPIFFGDDCKPYGRVLIVQENFDGCADGFCDVPDDEGWGGTITLHFDQPLVVCSVDLLDVDDAGGAFVRTFCDDCGGGIQQFIAVPQGADHSLVRVFLSPFCATRLEVEFMGSGAIAEWAYDFCQLPN